MMVYEIASLALRIWSLTALSQFKGVPWVLWVENRLWTWKTRAYFKIVPDSGELRGW